jgi:hypothetical protein
MRKSLGTETSWYFERGVEAPTSGAKRDEERSMICRALRKHRQTIGVKMREIVELLKPYALPEIQKNNFSRAVDIRPYGLH